jgi:uncharacterized protein (DUF1778 family)
MIRGLVEKSDTIVTLRLPKRMKDRLLAAAAVNNRSLTDFVLTNAQTEAEKVLASKPRAAA